MAPDLQDVFIIDKKSNNFTDKVDTVSFDDAINKIGFGKVQVIVLVVSGLVLMGVINETMGIGLIIPAAHCDLALTSSDKGLLTAISFLGIMLSSHLWGYLSDTRGRRNVIMFSLFAAFACTLISSLIKDFWLFTLVRFISGFCISGPSSTIYAYLGEFNEAKYRARVIAWASMFVAFAVIFMPAIGWWILPQQWSYPIYEGLNFTPWRLQLILHSIPGLLAALILILMPESPKFLLSQGRNKEALEILKWIYVKNTGNSVEIFSVKKLKTEIDEAHQASVTGGKGVWAIVRSMWNQTVPLLKPPHLYYFSICCILQFGIFVACAGVGLWFPDISNRISMQEGTEKTVCEIMDSSKNINTTTSEAIFTEQLECDDTVNTKMFIDNMTLGGFYVLAYIFLAVLIDPIGRGTILALSLFISGASGISLHFISEPTAILILFCCLMVFAGICISTVNAAVVDLFPTHLRVMAVCVTLMAGRLGTFIGSNVIGILLDYNCDLTFFLTAGIIIACGVLSFTLPCR